MGTKWSPSHINQPSPTWVKIIRWFIVVLQPVILGFVPSMPVELDTKYWITFCSSVIGSAAIIFGEGFKQKTLNEKAFER